MPDGEPGDQRSSETTSSSLLARVRSADDEAWQRLVALYGPLVHSWCCHAGLQSDDLADVFQEVFLAVHNSIGAFRADRPGDTFRGWLRTIARSKMADHYRRRSLEPLAAGGSQAAERWRELPEEEPVADDEASLSENRQLVCGAAEIVRAEFTDQTWRAFWKVAVEGQLTKDVADSLGMSVVAVRQAKSRVLRRLRQEFSELLDLPVPETDGEMPQPSP